MNCMIVLHPKHRLEYFKKKGWDKTSVKAAQKLVFKEFDCAYAHLPIGSETSEGSQLRVDNEVVYFFIINYRLYLTPRF